ncbi:heat shock protein 12.1 [Heterobasidion irregulare TC 32-1]|uniref:Heat shock protein 12.1 n=1 Tax=Heterobasidion irregulare (strain TC 32-1) TaxID=747525 RepID=W4K5R8_HETIT|nr:heat shock protein 12.1 [Heterobasidion irregulare TC 32-1]ETW80700.1 heat shock protein 12.1 [Heterobasidion irregulare TC 32-1]
MSNAGRQSFTDKMGSSMKPDSQKSATEQLGDKAKGMYENVASTVQPEKSGTQQAGDAISGNSNENQDSIMDKAKNAMGFGSSGTGDNN